ncbi:MAG: DegV family EDD domain-containing protein [Acetatifactor sp.]|nr:DegV family EDD domain-containing protein [Acetatifactor sp.]
MKFVTDSSCDIYELNGTPINVAPLKISTAEREFTDNESLNVHEMLDYLASYRDRSYTACPSTDSWLQAFEGGSEIYVVTMTSNLSGTYNSACIAKDLYLEKHPEAKICITDTLTTGPEMHLVMEKILEYKEKGRTFEEIETGIKDYLKTTRLFFSFKSLHNFAQNGRVSKVVASLVGKLNISIIGTATADGNIDPQFKIRGEKCVLNKLTTEMYSAGFKGGKLRICHIENEDLAMKLGDLVKEKYPDTDLSVYPARGLCSYYGERGGIIIGIEC